MLTYEGHDEPLRQGGPDPKQVDQPLTTPRGSWTENGKFFRAAMDFKSGLREKPELIKVYEKISRGIWSYKGFFELIDANIVSDGKRKVFKFSLKPVEKKSFGRLVELPHNRLIPTPVKVEVWRRDRGQCVQCGSTKNLHFDHDIPFSKGGSSALFKFAHHSTNFIDSRSSGHQISTIYFSQFRPVFAVQCHRAGESRRSALFQ